MMCISTGESCHGQPLLRRTLLFLPCLTQFVPYLALRFHSYRLYTQGNSLIRGPRDVLGAIIAQLGGDTYDCAEAHILAFQIGGNLYPVDPRDFGSQTYENTVSQCTPNLAVTDPPSSGFLYSWSIGDPFLKS